MMIVFVLLNSQTLAAFSRATSSPLARDLLVNTTAPFVPNEGQLDSSVLFQTQNSDGTLFFTRDGVVLALPAANPRGAIPLGVAGRDLSEMGAPRTSSSGGVPAEIVRIEFMGARPQATVKGSDLLPGVVNYFLGNDPAQWHTNIPTYAGIVYQDLYPGIDLHYEMIAAGENKPRGLKGTYRIAPGTDPSQIRWRYSGAEIGTDAAGNLHISYQPSAAAQRNGSAIAGTDVAPELVELAPISWQEINRTRVPVPTRYHVYQDGSIGFVLPGGYDKDRSLILDPTLVYSTYFGGGGEDNGSAISVTASGIYMSGLTFSIDFPLSASPSQPANAGSADAYVLKFSADGATLLYSTYLGGSGDDYGLGLAVDSLGNASVTGLTESVDFPFTPLAFDTTCGNTVPCVAGVYDAFVTRLNPTGSALLFSTYLGGDGLDIGYSMAVNSSGDIFVGGRAESTDFPTAGTPYQATNAGLADGFVAKLDPDEAGFDSLIYSTYLGGADNDRFNGIVIDGSDHVYAVGRSSSSNYPMAGTPFQNANAGGIDAVVTEFSSDGSGLIYSSYLGGTGTEAGFTIAIDAANRVYLTGQTISSDFPTSQGAFDTTCGTDGNCNGGAWDAFVVKIDPAAAGAASRIYATYFGGSGIDSGQSITVDPSGIAYLTGYTDSSDLPVVNAFQPICGWKCGEGLGYVDAFVARFSLDGSGLTHSTFLGGSSADYGIAITLDASNIPFVSGDTYSYDFPSPHAYDNTQAGNYDAFIAKIDQSTDTADLSVTAIASLNPGLINFPLIYTVTVTNTGASPATGVLLTAALSPAVIGSLSAVPDQGSCQVVNSGLISCTLKDLAAGAQRTVQITMTPHQAGLISNTASVTSNVADPNKTNNAVLLNTSVVYIRTFLPLVRKN
jgi:hypothetical protein